MEVDTRPALLADESRESTAPPPPILNPALDHVTRASLAMLRADSSGASTMATSRSSSPLTDAGDLDDGRGPSHKQDGNLSDIINSGSDDEQNEDGIVQIKRDGTSTALTRIKELVKRPPHEPKHRWETAYVYAFIERFTAIQLECPCAPQTIFEFEQALKLGGAPIEPETSEQPWLPSLDPVFKDFAIRLKKTDLAAGGSGGPKGGWQQWVPWWVNEQRKQGAPEFASQSWSKVISALKDKNTMYAVDWDRKLIVLRALVDAQLCLCDDVRSTINRNYGYVPQSRLKAVVDKLDNKDVVLATATTSAPLSAATTNGKTDNTAADDKRDVKGTGKATPAEKPTPSSNSILIRPLGFDSQQRRWYRIDDSPRMYVNSKPFSARQVFVAVTDTVGQAQEVADSLRATVKTVTGKVKTAAKGKGKQRESSWILKEQQLQANILKNVIGKLESEDSAYAKRIAIFEDQRNDITRKKERQARTAVLAAEKAAMAELRAQGMLNGLSGSRTSTRLRQATKYFARGYNDAAVDEELDSALQESDRAYKRQRRGTSGSEYSDSRPSYVGLDWTKQEDDEEEYDELASGSDEDEGQLQHRSSRQHSRRTTNGFPNRRTVMPGERRSSRVEQRQLYAEHSRESSPELDFSRRGGRGAQVVRPASLETPQAKPPEEIHPDYEEIWSKTKYAGYWYHGVFIKAKPGDTPLYKLARLGLPFPIPGPEEGGPEASNTSTTSNATIESVSASAVPTLEMDVDTVDEDGDEVKSIAGTIEAGSDDDDGYKNRTIQEGLLSPPVVVATPRPLPPANGYVKPAQTNGNSKHDSGSEVDELSMDFDSIHDDSDGSPAKTVARPIRHAHIQVVVPGRATLG